MAQVIYKGEPSTDMQGANQTVCVCFKEGQTVTAGRINKQRPTLCISVTFSGRGWWTLTHSCLERNLKNAVWIYENFENN